MSIPTMTATTAADGILPADRLDGIEAITPKPQGDVTLEKPAIIWVTICSWWTASPPFILTRNSPSRSWSTVSTKSLDLFAPNLILGISDEISSTGDIERIRLVGKIVDEYNRKLTKRTE